MVRAVFCSALNLGDDEELADICRELIALTAILFELNEYYRRKAELDFEYGKQLEKLARSAMQRHKNERNKRESWPLHSICALWQQLVDETKEEARERSAISELYAGQLTTLISQRSEDLHKISRKCREIGALAHGEVSRVLNELHTAMKTYQLCFAECSAVEAKYRQAEESKLKYEEENPTKLGNTRKHRSLAKLFDKRLEKYDVVRVKCLKARNEYLLCVQAANAALHKYFADDLSDLIDCMDLGMEQWLRGLISCTVTARKAICQKEMDALADLCGFKQSLDAKADKQRFFEANHAMFMLPKRFEFRGQLGDPMNTVSAAEGVAEELQQRQMQIERRLTNVRLESEEIWKSLESTERAVIEKHAEVMPSGEILKEARKESGADGDQSKSRHDLSELYEYYLSKFSHYLLNSNLIERLEARSTGIGSALSEFTADAALQKGADESSDSVLPTTPKRSSEEGDAVAMPHARRKKRIGGGTSNEEARRPRLFGGSLDEYVDATGEMIPLIVTSTIRVLSQFALHHQGIFRISGSQIEINAFKEAFERGEDPLCNVVDASDVNSVAGVLKLYLRELREPLFPIFLFDQLTECAKCPNPDDFIKQITPLLEKLSQPTLLVLRYLFAFLNHLSEFSDENMMDPYNLAICFGPTLLPIPEGKDQVFYHNFVNELVKNLIVYHDHVFSPMLPGPYYEKYLVESDQALYIDDPEGCASGDEEVSSTPMFESLAERLPSLGEISPASSFSGNPPSISPGVVSSAREATVGAVTVSKPTANAISSCAQQQSRASPSSNSIDANLCPSTVISRSNQLTSSVTSANASVGCGSNAGSTYPYSPLFHYHPELSARPFHVNADAGVAHHFQQGATISQRAPSLCSTGSTRSANCLDSAFLIRRYGSEQGPCPPDVEPFAHPTSAQIWTKRTGGASSLREQLHHTRTLQQHDLFRERPEDDTSFAANRARLHRLSLHTASPPASSLDGSTFGMRDGGSPLEGAVSPHSHSVDLPSARETPSLRERLAALSPMTPQLHSELKRRVLGEETTRSVEPDLVRSLPHDTPASAQPEQTSPKSQWTSNSMCSSSSPPPI
ncbi:SLIT-ROBO Rho GTPase-activating protein 1 [Toxocara canis]|uniref:SLIT-ROBO Rho GTPase-activating protein 1 n=1 Tax=Toxocara canis TaxID=6265 RepID=A0A0B2VYZ5_TOXCA|nr:SLIT-ROBO Rho GTPase-activating protein 1 [Toxocara canis]